MSQPDPDEQFAAALRLLGRCFAMIILLSPTIWLGRTGWFVWHAATTPGTI